MNSLMNCLGNRWEGYHAGSNFVVRMLRYRMLRLECVVCCIVKGWVRVRVDARIMVRGLGFRVGIRFRPRYSDTVVCI